MIGAGVGQLTDGFCWKITLSVAVTSLEKVGLDTVAFNKLVELARPPGGFALTLTVSVTGSLTVLPMLVVRVHFNVLSVQFQPLVESLISVAISPSGKVSDSVADGSIAVLVLVLVTLIVT